MFDIGFSEMIVIGVVALLVIGPEKLPRVARTIGALMGRAQRYVNDVKADINREIELDELKKLRTTVTEAAHSIESSVRETVSGFEAQARELNGLAGGAVTDAAPSGSADAAALAAADQAIAQSLAAADTPIGPAAATPPLPVAAAPLPAAPAPLPTAGAAEPAARPGA
ncbi:MAG: Sec-independent protein translocase subunit TatB [Burkholderiales bacterium]|nr:Sec-independent protein translocase subunit TatB [Burkholderiales bacterium]